MQSRFLVSAFVSTVPVFGFLLLCQGCASLHSELTSSRFESPETNGVVSRFQLQANLPAAQDVTIVATGFVNPPDFSQPTINNDTLMGAMASMGLVENLDVGVHTAVGPTPYVGVVKYQLVGPSAHDAKEGDSSLAVTASVGAGTTERSESVTFGSNTTSWSGKIKNTMSDVALIFGHRLSGNILLYGGPFYSDYKIETTLNQSLSTYSVNTTGYQRGVNAGLQIFLGSPVYVQLEAVYSDTHAADRDHSALRGAGSLGAYF